MNGSLMLFRSAAEPVLRPSCSRIPHLKAHILSRQSSSRNLVNATTSFKDRPRRCGPRFNVRTQSTFSAFDTTDFHSVYESEPQTRADPSQHGGRTDEVNKFVRTEEVGEQRQNGTHSQTRDSRADIEEIVDEGQPFRILHALLDPSLSSSFISGADDATFSRAFCALDPAVLVEPVTPIFRSMKASLHIAPKHRLVKSIEQRFESLSGWLDRIIEDRRRSGHKLQVEDFEHVLRLAEAMGDGRLAYNIFQTIMPEDEAMPSLKCYNYYIGALITSGRHEVQQKFLDRITPFSQSLRAVLARGDRSPPYRFEPPLLGIRPVRMAPTALRKAALEAFKTLTAKGLSGDEHTFANLMVAMGQNADVDGVKSILRSVWNINVDLLAQFDEEEIESPKFYEENHPLRPSQKLLSAIAHVFGSNNEMYSATSLVDYVSRNYNIEVSEHVWMQLYESTYVLSRARNKRKGERSRKLDVGQLESDALPKFYTVLTDEPHNLRPTIEMLIFQANQYRESHILDPAVELTQECLPLLDANVTELSRLYDELRVAIADASKEHYKLLPASFYDIRQAYLLQYFRCQSSVQLISVSFRNIFREGEWAGAGKETEWPRRQLPRLIEDSQLWLPGVIDYKLPSGHVVLENLEFHRNYAILNANNHFHAKAGIIARAVDTEDYPELISGIEGVNKKLNDLERRCTLCHGKNHSNHDCPKQDLLLAGLGIRLQDTAPGPISSEAHARSARKAQEWSTQADAESSRERSQRATEGGDDPYNAVPQEPANVWHKSNQIPLSHGASDVKKPGVYHGIDAMEQSVGQNDALKHSLKRAHGANKKKK